MISRIKTNITFTIKGKPITLTVEEAKELKKILDELFNKETVSIPSQWSAPIIGPQNPIPDFTITCTDGPGVVLDADKCGVNTFDKRGL